MLKAPKKFLDQSELKAFSEEHRRTIQYNMGKYNQKVREGKGQFLDLEMR